MELINKHKNLIVIILVIIVLSLSAYIVYDKVLTRKPDNKLEYNEKYNSNDYVNIVKISCEECKTDEEFNKAEFKNLPDELTSDFVRKHYEFEDRVLRMVSEGTELLLRSKVVKSVKNDILSVYGENSEKSNFEMHKFFSVNIDLENKKLVTNSEFISKNNINIEDLYKKVLENISDAPTEFFLESLEGDPFAPRVTKEEFKKNIGAYVNALKNQSDLVVLYYDEGSVYAAFIQSQILGKLGLGTHMGIGLLLDVQRVKLN